MQDNEYNITLESYENNILTLRAENVEDIIFKEKEDKYILLNQSYRGYETENKFTPFEVVTSFDILNEGDNMIELEIESIVKDKINGFEFKIN